MTTDSPTISSINIPKARPLRHWRRWP